MHIFQYITYGHLTNYEQYFQLYSDPSGTVTTEIDMDLKVKLLPSNTEDGQLVTADSAEAAQIGQEYFIVGVLSTPTSSTGE